MNIEISHPYVKLKDNQARKWNKDLSKVRCQATREETSNNYTNLHTTLPQGASKFM